MAKSIYDLIVIGSGPAGESAAMNAVKSGKKVAMICDKPRPGGNCTYLGTIPSSSTPTQCFASVAMRGR
jgi:NAD(P) transhydrogenase